tara:strand:- start:109 stop:420 length:312 start_codon:yes stop_codon:yes gene_type:complete
MDIDKIKDIELYLNKTKYLFVYFYGDWCSNLTENIDTYFKNKYDLSKKYVKVNIKNEKIIEKLGITSFPLIKLYEYGNFLKDINCTNDEQLLQNINNSYIFLK